MAVDKGLVSKASLTAIGNAIREKNKTTTQYKPSEMAAAISNLKTGDFMVATSDRLTLKVVQSANQIITSNLVVSAVNNSDGTVSAAFTDNTSISPYTNYIPGVIQRNYDDSTHTYIVTATDAEPIDGLVQDGWSVVYHKSPEGYSFYSNADYTGTYTDSGKLAGNILIAGMQNTVCKGPFSKPLQNNNILKFKNTFITHSTKWFMSICEGLTSAELPNLISCTDSLLWHDGNLTYVDLTNLTSAGEELLKDCSSLTSVELPNLTSAGNYLLYNCTKLNSVELPKLTTLDSQLLSMGSHSDSSPMYFIDFGHITNIYNLNFFYTQVMVLRADTVPTNFQQSKLSDPVLYIVPSALVDTYKSKVRSMDYVTALEKSPFADGKTVCGNNMQTRFGHADFSDTAETEDEIPDSSTKVLVYRPSTQTNGSWEYSPMDNVLNGELFSFWSKLTEEQGYTMPFAGSIHIPRGNTTFTVPDGVRVLKSSINDKDLYIGVTPGATYTVNLDMVGNMVYLAKCVTDNTEFFYFSMGTLKPVETDFFYSTEINAQTPTVTDYH